MNLVLLGRTANFRASKKIRAPSEPKAIAPARLQL